ncbi:MAG TPA: carbohydrate-binding protein, partial [Flavisolibacter sp.]|nr:carbohydrate-binding protein [Flavisolibacter sp.]
MRRILLLLMGVMLSVFNTTYGQTRLVVLGSSTSAGTGASVPDSAWVNRLQAAYAKNRNDNQDTTIINLGVGGYVTYKIMPNEYIAPAGRPAADTAHNVTKALSYAPSVIIINLPTNDVGNGYSRAEFIGNLRYLYRYIQAAGVKPYITTTQPRTQYDSNYRSILHDMVDSIMTSFGNDALDFWNGIATTDGLYNIKPELNSGDGVHLNDKGHGLLFDKVRAKNVFGTASINTPVNIHIEAEKWSAMSGVATENTTDVGGTQDVGWIDKNDWIEYSVNVPAAGPYTISFRLASPYTGSQFEVKNGAAVLSTIAVPFTTSWQVWQTVSKTVNLAAGTQTIRLQSVSTAGWNINWLEIAGASAANQPPTANAGADKTITLPANSVTLSGSGSDPDGSIASYAWSKVSGGAATINSPSAASTTVSGLAQGSYIFRLTVTDNAGATASDDVLVTVNGATGSSSRIEAENWSAMSGVLTENCSEGTLDVGWIDNGDW